MKVVEDRPGVQLDPILTSTHIPKKKRTHRSTTKVDSWNIPTRNDPRRWTRPLTNTTIRLTTLADSIFSRQNNTPTLHRITITILCFTAWRPNSRVTLIRTAT